MLSKNRKLCHDLKIPYGVKCRASNVTQFFVFKILHKSYFTLKVCIGIEITKPQLELNFSENDINFTAMISCKK